MHQASLLGQSVKDASHYGWNVQGDTIDHSWESLVMSIQNHIKSLNFGHRVQLKEKNVEYYNAKGSFVDSHTVLARHENGDEVSLSAEHIVIAVGGRPHYPTNVQGSHEHGITSDDLFFYSKPPGKTLVIGGSYVALECAGILAGLGCPAHLMIRSHPLKAFDRDMVNLVMSSLRGHGVQILSHCEPQSIERGSNGRLDVVWRDEASQTCRDQFDTVLFATGRQASTWALELPRVGVAMDTPTGKVLVDERDTTSVDNIHAIGDAAYGRWELTPVAVKAGKLLARRLFEGSNVLMNYETVPTTVFTPLEFASVGLSEEEAVSRYGNERVEVYHAFYRPLEYYLPHRDSSQCYIKMVCEAVDTERVLGLHLLGPNAGEVLQGFSTAINAGLTRDQLHGTIGIHPTCAEEVVRLHITKSSGADPTLTAC
ncbi:thioredoxin reductase 2, mitochondrial-like isoform X2 [Halichondria panicea]